MGVIKFDDNVIFVTITLQRVTERNIDWHLLQILITIEFVVPMLVFHFFIVLKSVLQKLEKISIEKRLKKYTKILAMVMSA